MRREDILIAVGASVLSAAAASAATWYFGVKKVAREYEERLETEVTESVKFFMNEVDPKVVVSDEDPDDVVTEIEKQNDFVEVEEVEVEELPEVEGERVFPNQGGMTLDDLRAKSHVVRYDQVVTVDTDSEDEEEEREPFPQEALGSVSWDPGGDDISIISRDLFLENTSGFEQTTLTYFQDGGVIDLDSELVSEHELLIGQGKPPFGQMSEDENIVYVRNKNVQTEYEVIQDPGNATDFLMHSLFDIYRSDTRT